MRELRAALGDDAGTPRFIETVSRRGYRFIAKIRDQQPNGPEPYALEKLAALPSASEPLESHSRTVNFVGRETELSRLQLSFERAVQGERQVLFVSGEAGIGKTTLVDRFLDQIGTTDGVLLGRGWCVEHYGAGEAYLPVLDAFGRLCRRTAGRHLLALLGQYAPTWLVQMPALLDATEQEALQRRTQGVSKERMLREMAETLEALTVERPLVLVLEDLQWSDYSTFDLLSFLARRRESARLFVIGTYRSGVVLDSHPLIGMKQELQAHGQCAELSVSLLSEQAVETYLSTRFSGDTFPPGLGQLLHQRTEGNPLFLVSVVDDFVRRGLVDESTGKWRWPENQDEVEAEVELGVPDNLVQLIEKQLAQLTHQEQRMLEAASLVGRDFSAAALAAGLAQDVGLIEEYCTTLARCGHFLSPAGVSEWPDGTLAGRYRFRHSLYQDVLSERLTPGQRLRLHRRIGERKEAGYGEQVGEIASELATHFEEGRDYTRAVSYLQQAAENARRRWAYHESVRHLTKGLGLLKHLRDSAERTQHELQLHFMLAEPLVALKGAAAPEVEQSYALTWDLYRQSGRAAQPFWALLGLWGVHFMRGELQIASELSDQLFALARQENVPLFLFWAQHANALTVLYRGDLKTAQVHMEQTIRLYDAQTHPRYMVDPKVVCLAHSALVLWLLGYPEQAVKKNHAALALARQLAHPFGLVLALDYSAGLYIARQEREAAQEFADAVTELALKHGFPHYMALGTIQQGWVRLAQGSLEQGIALMRQGIHAYRATGAKLVLTSVLPVVAGAYGQIGQPEEGLSLLDEAIAEMNDGGERWFEAAMYSVKGDLLLQTERSGRAVEQREQAEQCFLDALRVAQHQQAKSLELQATMSLCRLWQQTGRKEAALKKLRTIYDWFTEGFETASLREAKALLAELEP